MTTKELSIATPLPCAVDFAVTGNDFVEQDTPYSGRKRKIWSVTSGSRIQRQQKIGTTIKTFEPETVPLGVTDMTSIVTRDNTTGEYPEVFYFAA